MAEYLLKPGNECQRTDPVFFHALPDHNAEKKRLHSKNRSHTKCSLNTLTKNTVFTRRSKYCFQTKFHLNKLLLSNFKQSICFLISCLFSTLLGLTLREDQPSSAQHAGEANSRNRDHYQYR